MKSRLLRLVFVFTVLLCALPFVQALSQCGPGSHWVDNCAMADDSWQNITMTVYVDITGDCVSDLSASMTGGGFVHHNDPTDDSGIYPGTRPVDGHMDVLDAEITSMDFVSGSNGGVIGQGRGQGNNLQASLGVIAEDPTDAFVAESFFDVYCEAHLAGNYIYNQTAVRLEGVISQIPPYNTTYTFTGCLPAYTSPIPGQGTFMGNIVQVDMIIGAEASVPTMSQWGMLLMALILLALATIFIVRKSELFATER